MALAAGGLIAGGVAPAAVAEDPVVRISAIDSLDFGTFTGNSDLSAEDDVCVFNSSESNYNISFSTASGGFALTGSGGAIPFAIHFKQYGGVYGPALTYNTPQNFSGANTLSNTCGGMPNATYEVKLLKDDLLSVRPGGYTASLYILLEPPL